MVPSILLADFFKYYQINKLKTAAERVDKRSFLKQIFLQSHRAFRLEHYTFFIYFVKPSAKC
jgi:hypothetical protein